MFFFLLLLLLFFKHMMVDQLGNHKKKEKVSGFLSHTMTLSCLWRTQRIYTHTHVYTQTHTHKYVYIFTYKHIKEVYCKEMTHTVKETEKSHDWLSISWRPKKARGISQLDSKAWESWEWMAYFSTESMRRWDRISHQLVNNVWKVYW